MVTHKYSEHGLALLRLCLAILFILPGLQKLSNPSMIIGVLGILGFGATVFFGWLLLLSEIVFGVAVLVGYKLKYTVWPLFVIMLVAIITVVVPAMKGNPLAVPSLLFHILAMGGLVTLSLTGPGAYSVEK